MLIMDQAGAFQVTEIFLAAREICGAVSCASKFGKTNGLLDVQQIVILLGPLHKNVVVVFST